MKSILRYVGGKSRAVKHILPYLEDAEILYSPFFGGGSIEFAFSENGKVIACDLYEPVAVFWQETFKNPTLVADK
ncbi:MAG: adenine methyltransferase, partial [Crocinitomicaceae bacterium]|nr:adenine methyltransferase [Crocinitomicaceae bacterium]